MSQPSSKLKKTPITDKNGVKTSRLKKRAAPAKAASPVDPSTKSTTPLAPAAPRGDSSSVLLARAACMEEVERLVTSFKTEWPELAPDTSPKKPPKSSTKYGFEFDEFRYAAVVEYVLTNAYGFENTHEAVLSNRPSLRDAFAAGYEPTIMAQAVAGQ